MIAYLLILQSLHSLTPLQLAALSNIDSSTDVTMKITVIKNLLRERIKGAESRRSALEDKDRGLRKTIPVAIKIFKQRLKSIGKKDFVMLYLFVFLTLTNLLGLCFLFL